jgi:hypothetical protein
MSIDTLEPALDQHLDQHPLHDEPACVLVRPALLAGEECEAPDPWIFRGTD